MLDSTYERAGPKRNARLRCQHLGSSRVREGQGTLPPEAQANQLYRRYPWLAITKGERAYVYVRKNIPERAFRLPRWEATVVTKENQVDTRLQRNLGIRRDLLERCSHLLLFALVCQM